MIEVWLQGGEEGEKKSGRERVGEERGKSLTPLLSSFLLDLKKEAAENERKRKRQRQRQRQRHRQRAAPGSGSCAVVKLVYLKDIVERSHLSQSRYAKRE